MPATRASIKQELHDLGETDASKRTVFFERALTKACFSFFFVGRHSKDLKTDLAQESCQPQLCSHLLCSSHPLSPASPGEGGFGQLRSCHGFGLPSLGAAGRGVWKLVSDEPMTRLCQCVMRKWKCNEIIR